MRERRKCEVIRNDRSSPSLYTREVGCIDIIHVHDKCHERLVCVCVHPAACVYGESEMRRERSQLMITMQFIIELNK